jgi:L-amino acid N-acyltransferase YncA
MIRRMEAQDKEAVLGLIRATGFFTPAEVDVAEELMDAYLEEPEQKDYDVVVVENEAGAPAGYMTWGPTPLAEDAYDLYWSSSAGSRPRSASAGGGSSSSRRHLSRNTTARDSSISTWDTRKSPGSRTITGPGTIASSTRSIFVRS